MKDRSFLWGLLLNSLIQFPWFALGVILWIGHLTFRLPLIFAVTSFCVWAVTALAMTILCGWAAKAAKSAPVIERNANPYSATTKELLQRMSCEKNCSAQT